MRRLILTAALLLLPVIASAAPGAVKAEAEKRVISLEINKGQMVHLDRIASSVMIADPVVADIQVISPRLIYVQAKKIGETSLYAIDANDRMIIDTTIEVTHNVSKLDRAIKRLVPSSDVTISTVDGGIVLNGYVDSPAEAESIKSLASSFIGPNDKLVNMITTAGSDQVTLMVKVAEVSRNEVKRFGINLMAALSSGNIAFQLIQGRTFLNTAGTSLIRNTSDAGTDNSLYGAYSGGNKSLSGIIDALETQGLISVLAEPNLTTTSGKAANFLAGGEFPVPIVDSEGKVNVQYKPFGIGLNFTPTVMSEDKISLNVAPEVSSISRLDSLSLGSNTAFVIPSIQTRRASTTVEIGSGQTLAIAGLLKNDRNNSVDKFPGLGDVPVLGALFRSQQFQNDQSELVILVTPYIVRPVSERKQLQSPLDGYVPPNDLERLMVGKLYAEHDAPKQEDGGENKAALKPQDMPRLNGNGGFILE